MHPKRDKFITKRPKKAKFVYIGNYTIVLYTQNLILSIFFL